MSAKRLKRFERNVAKARAKDSLRAFEKLTERVDGELVGRALSEVWARHCVAFHALGGLFLAP